MRHYETTFIIDPTLSGDEIKATAKLYTDFLTSNDAELVHFEEMGVRQLTYPMSKKTSGAYFFVEYKLANTEVIEKM